MLFCCCRLNDVNEPLRWKESFENLLSSQSESSLLCFDSFISWPGVVWRCWPETLLRLHRWTVPVQGLPGVRVQRGERGLLSGLWGLQSHQAVQAGPESEEDLRGVHRLRCPAGGERLPPSSFSSLTSSSKTSLTSLFLLSGRWTSTTQPKPSPRRTWSGPLRPASTRPRLRSTSWWRKTATPVSSSPQCTWIWPERPERAKSRRTFIQAADTSSPQGGGRFSSHQRSQGRFRRSRNPGPKESSDESWTYLVTHTLIRVGAGAGRRRCPRCRRERRVDWTENKLKQDWTTGRAASRFIYSLFI